MKEQKTQSPDPITPENQPEVPAVAPPPATTAPGQAPGAYSEDPGQTLGIIGLVANILGISPAGIVFGVLSRNKSRAAGFPTTLGTISMIWGIVGTALAALVIMAWVAFMIFAFAASGNSFSSGSSITAPEYDYSDSSSI